MLCSCRVVLTSPAEWSALAARAVSVVNAAGIVSLVRPLSDLLAANSHRMLRTVSFRMHCLIIVFCVAVAWTAQLALEAGCALHHISSLSVFASAVVRPEQTPCSRCDTTHVYGNYAASKIAGETEALAAAAAGVLAVIYRPAMLSVSARGEVADDYLSQFVALCRAGGAVPALPGATDVSDVNRTAECVAGTVLATIGSEQTQRSLGCDSVRFVHIANDSGPPLTTSAIASELQLPLVAPAAWVSRVREAVPSLYPALLELIQFMVMGGTDGLVAWERLLFPAAGVDFGVSADLPPSAGTPLELIRMVVARQERMQ